MSNVIPLKPIAVIDIETFDEFTPKSSGCPQMDAEFVIQLLEMH